MQPELRKYICYSKAHSRGQRRRGYPSSLTRRSEGIIKNFQHRKASGAAGISTSALEHLPRKAIVAATDAFDSMLRLPHFLSPLKCTNQVNRRFARRIANRSACFPFLRRRPNVSCCDVSPTKWKIVGSSLTPNLESKQDMTLLRKCCGLENTSRTVLNVTNTIGPYFSSKKTSKLAARGRVFLRHHGLPSYLGTVLPSVSPYLTCWPDIRGPFRIDQT